MHEKSMTAKCHAFLVRQQMRVEETWKSQI